MVAQAEAVALGCPSSHSPDPSLWSARFLQRLPTIVKIAHYAFRGMRAEPREEATQEVVASCFAAYARLVARGRECDAFVSPLARFAIRQYRAGRRLGSNVNTHDLTSPCRHRKTDATVLSLFQSGESRHWRELTIQDRRATPADIGTVRVDFEDWLQWLSQAKRRAAELLASGAGTGETAAMLGLTAARVSQLRRELKDDWARFHGEPVAA